MPLARRSESLAVHLGGRYEGPVDQTDTRYGSVTEEPGGARRLEFRRTWADDGDDVWAALTGSDRTARWIGTYEGERRTGGTGSLTMTAEAGAPTERLTIVECTEPPGDREAFVAEVGPRYGRTG